MVTLTNLRTQVVTEGCCSREGSKIYITGFHKTHLRSTVLVVSQTKR